MHALEIKHLCNFGPIVPTVSITECTKIGMIVCYLWKLNPSVRKITLTKIANYTCKLHTKETEYGAEH